MALPSKFLRVIDSIVTNTDPERRLLHSLLATLESNLEDLRKIAGSDCGERCYRHLIKCIFQERSSGCLDQYEQWVERCLADRLGRMLTEAEDELLGELLNEITGITETVFKLAGMELADEPDEEEEAASQVTPPTVGSPAPAQ